MSAAGITSADISSFVGSYFSTMLTMCGIALLCLCASKYRTFKANKKMKSMFVAGIVLFAISVAAPFLVILLMLALTAVMLTSDSVSLPIDIMLNSSIFGIVLSYLAYAFKIGGIILLGIVCATVFKRNAPSAEQSAQSPQDVSFSDNAEQVQFDAQQQSERSAPEQSRDAFADDDAYMSLGICIVLWCFTFGIGFMIWVRRMTEYLNRTPVGDQYKPVAQLLLCGFVPFYSIFWFHKHGQKLQWLLQESGSREDISTLCTVLGVVCPLAAAIIMQDKCNKLIEGYRR